MSGAKPKARMGRPPMPKDQVKVVLQARVSPAEKAAIEAVASKAGVTASRWAGDVLRRALARNR